MSDLHVTRFVLGPLETNCYLITNQQTKEAIVIDPGMDCEPLLQAIKNLAVTDILLTHAHFDHIGGVGAVNEATEARIWVHPLEREWLVDAEKNRSVYWLPQPIVAPPANAFWQGGETIEFLGVPARVLFTPGHSPGHVSLQWPDFVISGDALFAGSIGRTDLPGGNHAQLLQSIEEQLLTLPDETLLLPGHGPETSVGDERRSNPFLI